MKKYLILLLLTTVFAATANPLKNSGSNVVPIIDEPQFSGVNCSEQAISMYDELINQEVNLETAFETSFDFLVHCLDNQ